MRSDPFDAASGWGVGGSGGPSFTDGLAGIGYGAGGGGGGRDNGGGNGSSGFASVQW